MRAEEYTLPILCFNDTTISLRLHQWIKDNSESWGRKDIALTIVCAGYRYDSNRLHFACAMRQRKDLPYITSKHDPVSSGIVILEDGNIAYLAESALWMDIVKPCGRDTTISLLTKITPPVNLAHFAIDHLPAEARICDMTEISNTSGQTILVCDSLGKWYYHVDSTCIEEVTVSGPTRDSLCMYMDSYIESLIHTDKLRFRSPRRPWSVDADVLCLYFGAEGDLADVHVIHSDSNRRDNGKGADDLASIIRQMPNLPREKEQHYPCVYLYVFRDIF